LHLLSVNLDEATLDSALTSILVTTMLGLGITVLIGLPVNDIRRGALASSTFLALFCSYGYLFPTASESELSSPLTLTLWTTLTVALVALATRHKKHVNAVTRCLNIMFALMLLFPAVIVLHATATHHSDNVMLGGDAEPVAVDQTRPTPETAPDIVYLIFDRYGRADTLKTVYGFDNEPFLDELRDRGFKVGDRALANYPKTVFSLGAATNMRYMNDLDADRIANPGLTAAQRLQDNLVSRELAAHGYYHAQIGSWWWPTATSPYADHNYSLDALDEFTEAYFKTTLLGHWAPYVPMINDRLDRLRVRHARLAFQLDSVREALHESDRPAFVFMHATMPHPPYVFRADGSYLPPEEIAELTIPAMYVDSVRHANRAALELIDDLLSVPADERPIIIFQSDEGPHPLAVPGVRVSARQDQPDWPGFTDGQLLEKFGIVSAFYLPGPDAPELPPDLSPVNTFRLVFREYLGRHEFDPLPDRSFVWSGPEGKDPIDVTDRLQDPDAQERDEVIRRSVE
jgi:hypothetical protein